jgi:hypothetical protein
MAVIFRRTTCIEILEDTDLFYVCIYIIIKLKLKCKVKVKLSPCLINYLLRHEYSRGSGDTVPPVLTSALDEGE